MRLILMLSIPLGILLMMSGQDTTTKSRDRAVQSRIDPTKPTIFISYDHRAPRKPLRLDESSNGIWLKLNNNSPWAIKVCLRGDDGKRPVDVQPLNLKDGTPVMRLRNGTEYPACHGIEMPSSEDTSLGFNLPSVYNGYNVGHTFASAWLASGDSVQFNMPEEHMTKSAGIYISYHYEWEIGLNNPNEDRIMDGEPEHRSYFYRSQLPRSAVQKNK